MNREIIKKRIKTIRQILRSKNTSLLLVTKPANVTYLTGFSGDDSWALISPGAVCLLTDSRYAEQANAQCPACKIIVRKNSLGKTLAKLLSKLRATKSIMVENSTSVNDYQTLKKEIKIRCKPSSNLIESIRSIKDQSEINLITKAGKIASNALKRTLPAIKTGISENELAGILDFQIRKFGAKNSFDTVVAFGPNASKPHHQPTSRKLKKSDTILIDFGAKYKNYCSDITRCFVIGKPTASYLKAYKAVKQAQAAAISKIKPGVKISDIDSAARKVLREHNLPVYGHGTGHGLGLEVHELPVVSKKIKETLQAGNVITVEPAVYLPGKFGIRLEDDCLVTKTGCKILTKPCPNSLCLRRTS